MTQELRALIRRFCIEATRREMTDNQLPSYNDSSISYAKQTVKEVIVATLNRLEPEDFRG